MLAHKDLSSEGGYIRDVIVLHVEYAASEWDAAGVGLFRGT